SRREPRPGQRHRRIRLSARTGGGCVLRRTDHGALWLARHLLDLRRSLTPVAAPLVAGAAAPCAGRKLLGRSAADACHPAPTLTLGNRPGAVLDQLCFLLRADLASLLCRARARLLDW